MTLREFLDNISSLVEKDKSLLDLKVITSKDDEGNGFLPVTFSPSIGFYEEEEFIALEVFKDYYIEDSQLNCICIN